MYYIRIKNELHSKLCQVHLSAFKKNRENKMNAYNKKQNSTIPLKVDPAHTVSGLGGGVYCRSASCYKQK